MFPLPGVDCEHGGAVTRKRRSTPSRKNSRSGIRSNKPHVRWWKKPAFLWAGGIATTLIASIVTAFGNNIGQELSAKPDPSISIKPLSIGSLAIAESGHDLQLTVPIFNQKSSYQQVQDIALDISWSTYPDSGCPLSSDLYAYNISQNLIIEKSNKVLGSATSASGIAAGSTVLARGKISTWCDGKVTDLNLAFSPPALILAGGSAAVTMINIPEAISAKAPSPGFSSDYPASSISFPSIRLTGSNRPVHFFFIEAGVSIRTSAGMKTSACKELDSSISIKPVSCSRGWQ